MNYKQRTLFSDALEFSLKGVGKEWLWCVDPIDGTTNFASGLPVSWYSINCFSKLIVSELMSFIQFCSCALCLSELRTRNKLWLV